MHIYASFLEDHLEPTIALRDITGRVSPLLRNVGVLLETCVNKKQFCDMCDTWKMFATRNILMIYGFKRKSSN